MRDFKLADFVFAVITGRVWCEVRGSRRRPVWVDAFLKCLDE